MSLEILDMGDGGLTPGEIQEMPEDFLDENGNINFETGEGNEEGTVDEGGAGTGDEGGEGGNKGGDTGDEGAGGGAGTDAQIFQDVASTWRESGLLGDLEEDDLKVEDEAGFIALLDKQADRRAKQLLVEKYGEQDAEYVAKAGELGIDPNYLKGLDEYIGSIEGIFPKLDAQDEETAQARKNILLTLHKERGFSDAAAEKSVQRIIDANDDVAEAKEAAGILVELGKTARTNYLAEMQSKIDAKKQEALDFQKDVKDTITKKKEIIPSIPIDGAIKSKMIDGILRPTATSKVSGKPISKVDKYIEDNPKDSRVILGYLLEVTDGFKDWSKVARGAKKQVNSSLANKLKDANLNKGGSGGNSKIEGHNDWDIQEFNEEYLRSIQDR